ncbi:MAG: hypothetical protein V3R98_07585 [Alphaproteobacteria bacterium]
MPFGSRSWWAGLLRDGFGVGFWGFAAFAVLSGLACYLVLGPEAFGVALDDDLDLLLGTVPRIVAALAVAGLVWAMLPRDRLTRLIGRHSGLRGLAIATAAGIVTPGGPTSAFALLAVIGGGGADRGALVAYITGWSMLGVQRLIVWDVPFMGVEFSATRFVVSLPLPIIAGLIARALPLRLTLAAPTGPEAGSR